MPRSVWHRRKSPAQRGWQWDWRKMSAVKSRKSTVRRPEAPPPKSAADGYPKRSGWPSHLPLVRRGSPAPAKPSWENCLRSGSRSEALPTAPAALQMQSHIVSSPASCVPSSPITARDASRSAHPGPLGPRSEFYEYPPSSLPAPDSPETDFSPYTRPPPL